MAGRDLRGRPQLQVPDLRAEHAAVPGELPLGRGHPRLHEHRPRHREAARRRVVAGARVASPDRGQSLPRGDGARLPGAVRVGLQPQRGRGACRHQLGRALPRRVRDRERPGVRRSPGDENRQEGRRDRRRPRRIVVRLSSWRSKGHDGHRVRRARPARRHDALRHPGLSHAPRRCSTPKSPHPGARRRSRAPARRIGTDVTLEQIDEGLRRGVSGHGRAVGRPLPVPGAEAPNCVTATAFLRAFNDGRLQSRRPTRGRDRRRRHVDRRGDRGAPARPHRAGARERPSRDRDRWARSRRTWPRSRPATAPR